MINQSTFGRLLGIFLLSSFLMVGISNVNSISAQSTIDATGGLSETELANFEAEYEQIVQEIKDNTNLTETEQSVKLFFYDEIQERVNYGRSINNAIEASVVPTREYATKFKEGDLINFIHLVSEAKNRLL